MRSRVWMVLLMALVALGPGACKRSDGGGTAVAARSPATIRRDGNHLADAASAYLRAHGHDPVDWYPWGPEALARAKAENKPIFLSIGYVACHWCHVMQHEVFSRDDVATVLNDRFVSIKVDREERPDLDRVYLSAVEAMTGSGGWPATLLLTPAQEPFFGATYVEHDRFLDVLARGARAYASGDAEIATTTAELRRALAPHDPASAERVGPEDLHGAALAALQGVDMTYGGFRSRQKFPIPGRWSFLLHAWRKWGDAGLGNALRVTLDAMAAGALRDPVSAGFHRYTTDATWSTPHFEEMLYDNAQLASLYLEAGVASGEPRWTRVAQETLDFIVSDMTTASGAFAASFDADTAGAEGVAWTWSRDELVAVLGPKDGAVVATLLDVGDAKRAPARRTALSTVAARSGVTEAEVEQLWNRARPKLREARQGKAIRDDKVVTAWNGLAIGALARGSAALGQKPWLDAALRAAEQVWRVHHEEAHRLLRTSTAPPSDAVLDDYACLADGFLALFEASGDAAWLDRALVLVDEARARLAAPKGGFYASEAVASFARTVPLEDSAEPSGNAVMLHVLLRLSHLDARSAEWSSLLGQTLATYAGPMRERGAEMAGWLDAALLDAGPFYELVIAGALGDASALDRVGRELLPPWVATVRVPATGADAALVAKIPSLADKTAGSGTARAFVCQHGACKLPSSDPTALRRQLLTGWGH